MTKDTWDKKIRIGDRYVTKRYILRHYAKLWKNDPEFRRLVKKKGVFVRAVYGNRPIIKRHNIRINNFEDIKELIKEHAVEFHIPQKKLKDETAIDIDVPKKLRSNGKKTEVLRDCIKYLKRGTKIKAVVRTPDGGYHIHVDKIPKRTMIKLLKPIAQEHAKFVDLGKRKKKDKINIDVAEPNIAIPGSMSVKGKTYKRLR